MGYPKNRGSCRIMAVVMITALSFTGNRSQMVWADEPIPVEQYTDPTAVAEAQRQMAEDADFTVARSRILPQLAPRSIFTEKQRNSLVHSEFLHDLILYYVVDHPEVQMPAGMAGYGRRISRFIYPRDLQQWQVTEQELFRTAMENINAPERIQTFREVTSAPGKMFVVVEDDGFAAARMLSIGLLTVWAEEVRDDLVIAVPTKDVLYATPHSNKEGIAYLKKLASRHFKTEARPLTSRLFLFHLADGTISVFEEASKDEGHGERYVFHPNGPVHGGPVMDVR